MIFKYYLKYNYNKIVDLIINYNKTTPENISIIATLTTIEKINFKLKAEMTII